MQIKTTAMVARININRAIPMPIPALAPVDRPPFDFLPPDEKPLLLLLLPLPLLPAAVVETELSKVAVVVSPLASVKVTGISVGSAVKAVAEPVTNESTLVRSTS
jgi:hypothetical protein